MKSRAFSLIEVSVVVVIVGVAGGMAVQSLARTVRGARAGSERTAVVLEVKQHKMHAVERLQGLVLTTPASNTLKVSRAVITRTTGGVISGCTAGATLDTETYTALALSVQGGTAVCFDENGRPVDANVGLNVDADTNGDGVIQVPEKGGLAWSALGTLNGTGSIVGALANAVGGIKDGALSLDAGRGADSILPLHLPLPLPLP